MFSSLRLYIFLLMSKVHLALRMSACSKENEEYSLCGWKCPPTCVNIKLNFKGINCPFRWDCRIGCRCSPGYIRDEYSGNCVQMKDCPVAAAAAAPALSQGELPQETAPEYEQYLREKRSSYGSPYYAPAPCGSAHLPYIAPVHHAAYPQQHYSYGAQAYPHYREAEDVEMMSFSDVEHGLGPMFDESMARYAYAGPAGPVAPHYGGVGAGVAASAGPAIGVFPNANAGGCSVPLLLTCSPSIRPGHIVKSSYGHPDVYRGADEAHNVHDHDHAMHEEHDQMPAQEQNPSQTPLHQ